MGVCVVPILNKVLLKFFPYIYVWGRWYWSSHDPVFYASFPFGYCRTLYEGEGMRDLLIWVIHEWGIRVEELVEFELVYKFVGSCSISGKDCRFFFF